MNIEGTEFKNRGPKLESSKLGNFGNSGRTEGDFFANREKNILNYKKCWKPSRNWCAFMEKDIAITVLTIRVLETST